MSYFSSSHVSGSLSHWMWRRDHKRMEHKRMDIYRIDHRMDHKRRICENTRTSFSTGTVTDRLESHRKYRTPGYGNVFDVEGKSLAVLSLSAFLLILALPHPNSWHRTPLNSCTDWRYWVLTDASDALWVRNDRTLLVLSLFDLTLISAWPRSSFPYVFWPGHHRIAFGPFFFPNGMSSWPRDDTNDRYPHYLCRPHWIQLSLAQCRKLCHALVRIAHFGVVVVLSGMGGKGLKGNYLRKLFREKKREGSASRDVSIIPSGI